MRVLFYLALIAGLCKLFVFGHVRLTYPPARYPPLDFLDNQRTQAPCGVPKPKNDKGIKTTLKAGSKLNVTWSLSYPHQGGFRLEVLDELDHVRDVLTPNKQIEYVGTDDPTLQIFQITLPSEPCRNCAIRLLREAKEWGGSYKFWSCADVDIESTNVERCSNHGVNVKGQCQCDRVYNGNVCQYEDECFNDQDCNGNGKCVELAVFHYPRKVCYCKAGWFGPKCEQVSQLKALSFDPSFYQIKNLADGENKLYWRIIKQTNEIEFVMQYYSKSWVAVGWKPSNVDSSCSNLQRFSSLLISEPYTEPPTEPAKKITENVNIEKNEILTPSTPFKSTETASTHELGFNIVPKLNNTVPGIFIVTPEESKSTQSTGKPVVPVSVGGIEAEVEGESCYGSFRWPPECRDCDYRLSWTYVDELDEVEFSLETRVPSNWWSGIGFSRTGKMPGSDMIIVQSMDSKITIQDAHTKDYSVPIADQKQNVQLPTDIVGTHINGVLRTAFRRGRKNDDREHDYQFNDTDCFYFLFPVSGGRLDAKGQMAQHLDTPKVSKQKICVKACTENLPTQQAANCQREFKFPSGCNGAACDYAASWSFNPQTESVDFEISSRELGRWTGIGFSSNGNMTNSDIILGWVFENGTYVTDRFAYGKQQPTVDKHQDLTDIEGRAEDDVQTIYFSRKLETDDLKEDLSLLDCLYYLFPVGGGRVLARNADDLSNPKTAVGFHDLYVPKVSQTPVCICTDDGFPLLALNETLARRRKRGSEKGKEKVDLARNKDLHNKNETYEAAKKILINEKKSTEVLPTIGTPSGQDSNTKEGLHLMDCADIVVGSAVGSMSRIEDYYTVSRATPMVDEVYGGRQSITSAIGYEENDITTIIFRRKLSSSDPADHSISEHQSMTVIWAKGQDPDHVSHSVQSGLEATNRKGFYSQDVFAYHGNVNRGSFSVNFFDKAAPDPQTICRGEQTFPPGCSGGSCIYNITWSKVAENVIFELDVKLNREKWTGIGFSKDGAMLKSDAVIIQVNPSGPIEVTDRFMPKYSRPVVDGTQNIFNVDARYINGRVSASFTRPVTTDDDKEDVNLNECFYFLYPFQGGQVLNGDILKHNDTPGRSEQICFNKCIKFLLPTKKPTNDVDGSASASFKKYLASVRILNYDWSDSMADPNDEKFKVISDKIVAVIDNSLSQKFKQYQKSEIQKLRPGSVIADVVVTAADVSDKEILDTLVPIAKSGIVQGLKMDPDTISVQEIRPRASAEDIRNYIIIAIAVFIVVVLVISGMCLICFVRRKRMAKAEKTSSHHTLVPFSPYAYMLSANNKHPTAYQYPRIGQSPPTKKAYDNYNIQLDYTPSYRTNERRHYAPTISTHNNESGSSMVDQSGDSRPNSSPRKLRRIFDVPPSTVSANHPHVRASPPKPTPYHGTPRQGRASSSDAAALRRGHSSSYHHQSHQESSHRGGNHSGPFVQYPSDPQSYYTMNGVNRVPQPQQRRNQPRNGTGGYFGP